jgi:hypothetical protein
VLAVGGAMGFSYTDEGLLARLPKSDAQ